MQFDVTHWMNKKTFALSTAQMEENRLYAETFNREKPFLWDNHEKNMPLINDNNLLSRLSGACEGTPMLVVGAGRTTLDNIDIIKEMSENFFIIAIDRIVSTLKDNGIKPDLIFTIDAQECVGKFLECVDSADIVAMNTKQNPGVVRSVMAKTEKVYFYGMINMFDGIDVKIYEQNKELPFLRPGSVAGYSATDLAYWLSCGVEGARGGYVVLIGNELGWFSEEDMSKETDEYIGREWLETQLPDGSPFYTIHNFKLAAENFGDFEFFYPDAVFIDCSGGIAKTKYKTDIKHASFYAKVFGGASGVSKLFLDFTAQDFWERKAS